jgi:hypothetical protein
MQQKVSTPVAVTVLVVVLILIGFIGWKVFFAPPPPLPMAAVNEDREGPEYSPMSMPRIPGQTPTPSFPPEPVSGAPSTNR